MNPQYTLPMPASDDELPLDAGMDTVPPGTTRCNNCGDRLERHEDVLVTTKHFGPTITHQFHYCGQDCANEHALKRLREGGL